MARSMDHDFLLLEATFRLQSVFNILYIDTDEAQTARAPPENSGAIFAPGAGSFAP